MILTITLNPAQDRIYPLKNFRAGELFRSPEVTVNAAGKGVNSARVLSELGKEVQATGFIGGKVGKYITEQLQNKGIMNQFTSISGTTRICIKIADNEQHQTTEILESGPQISDQERENFISRYCSLLDSCSIVTAAGSLPPGLPPDFYRQLGELARKKDTRFLLDTGGETFREGIKARPFMIKPNQDEINDFLDLSEPQKEDYCEALRVFGQKGITLPVISLGAEGSLALINGDVYHFRGPELEVKNVVGSGDAFVAGCAAYLEEGRDFIEVLKMGTACGAANTQFYKTGKVTSDLVDKFLDRVKVSVV
ncbi:MAG: 1-phosphofructokinase family hexose kinase [Bacillota bacterium]